MRLQGYLGPSFPYFEIIAFYLQTKEKAERVGFEPTRRLFAAYAISSRAPSANSDTSPCVREFSRWRSEDSPPERRFAPRLPFGTSSEDPVGNPTKVRRPIAVTSQSPEP